VLNLLSNRVIPEIKRAFQADIANADRILIARYDDTGHFKRHRDDAAPHTAFREFAISLNLNTDEYEGGELLFPEYDDQRYSPPAGAAIVFSASLLHEAAPVTRGSRYVLLSFLGSAAAQARLTEWVESQKAPIPS
jgi:predicted 2-oxoglutarate/Fe(II)-dependent dioxygenase YbiX